MKWTKWTAAALAVTSVYFIVAYVGLRYASIGVSVSPVWPPTGFAIAVVLFLGGTYLPAVFAGALLANAMTAEVRAFVARRGKGRSRGKSKRR
jgi:integral membrane sensor domain MASE1